MAVSRERDMGEKEQNGSEIAGCNGIANRQPARANASRLHARQGTELNGETRYSMLRFRFFLGLQFPITGATTNQKKIFEWE